MTSSQIQMLAHYMPDSPVTLPVDNFSDRNQGDVWHFHDPRTMKLLCAYKNLAFGWDLVRNLVRTRSPLPAVLDTRDEWICRAYLYCKDSTKYNDRSVRGALALTTPAMRHTREMLQALLVCKNAEIEDVAAQLHIHEDTLKCYEQLFFNIIDRKLESAFLSEVVYPDTRFAELMNHYLQNENLGKLLLRMGYNNGPTDVLYFAGFRPEVMEQVDSRDVPSRLEALFAANAYMYLRAGLGNQNIQAIRDGKNLIAAAKQGGEDLKAGSPFRATSAALADELKHIKGNEALSMILRLDRTAA